MAGNLILAAKVDVPADLVRRLLAGQHPDLARLPVRFLYRTNGGSRPRVPLLVEQGWRVDIH